MYKYYEEHYVSHARERRVLLRLYTTHFEVKIKPGPSAILAYYYSVSYCNQLLYIYFLSWLKYDQFMAIRFIHCDIYI